MSTYNIPLDAQQISDTLAKVHGADSVPTVASENMVQSGGLSTYLEAFRAGTGWGTWDDLDHTVSTPFVATGRTRITIDGAGPTTYVAQNPAGADPLWDTINDLIMPENSGDGMILRIDFKCTASSQNSYMDLELDISAAKDGSIKILLDTIPFLKLAGTEMRFTRTYFIYARDTFAANGGALFMDPSDSGATVTAYDFDVQIGRFHKAL